MQAWNHHDQWENSYWYQWLDVHILFLLFEAYVNHKVLFADHSVLIKFSRARLHLYHMILQKSCGCSNTHHSFNSQFKEPWPLHASKTSVAFHYIFGGGQIIHVNDTKLLFVVTFAWMVITTFALRINMTLNDQLSEHMLKMKLPWLMERNWLHLLFKGVLQSNFHERILRVYLYW